MNVLISAIRRPRRDISLVEKRGCQVLLAILSIILSDPLAAASLPISHNEAPVAVSADFADFCWIDDLVEEAIRQQRLPGAVILVGQYDRILYRKAFGHRSLVPDPESMTIDTVFDLASLTKVVATTTSIMQLVDSGRISLEDPVTRYIPEFKRHGKSGITVQHLLTHMSGLRPGINPARPWHGYRDAIEQITDDVPRTPPGENIVYSDVNFILLGEIVRRVSGMSLDQFAHEHLFEPLGMQDTMYHPPEKIRARIAPTERCWKGARPCGGPDGTMLRGLVHDPSARRMGGSPGHAGLFSTVDDLSIFCRMLLGDGLFGQTRLLSPATILAMISPSTPLDKGHLRALGWSLDTTCHDGNKKPSPLPIDHSGFTGTKLWLHPATGLYVVFLSNRLHPSGKGDVFDLREHIITIAVSVAAGQRTSAQMTAKMDNKFIRPQNLLMEKNQPGGQVLSGLDILRAEDFNRLRGRKIGLLTNQTGRARDGVSAIDLLDRAANLELIVLFSPEHGIRGIRDDRVPSLRDPKTGRTIHSLYGKSLRPSPDMLAGIDTIVVDLQDIGTRFYTYMSTMAYMMESAAKQKVRVMVLDRPNPINGLQIEGPILDQKFIGFTGYFPMPIRHGLTMGELALLFRAENDIAVELTVVTMKGWQRRYWFDETGLPWVNPSPNMRNLIQATLYPGIGAIEGTPISVGRGTGSPFEQIGAPWIDGVQLAGALNARGLVGVRFYPVSFIPQSSKFAGQKCQGVYILVTDRRSLHPVRLGLEIAVLLYRLYPNNYRLEEENLLGSEMVLSQILAGEDPADIVKAWQADETEWQQLRQRYLLYPNPELNIDD
ncbi:MAG: DUF1343 domain-containing protein [Desulfobacterales bacterium]|jgi:uncharacterized protein YbbC (DUF1343 family)/CubicO group peptidase (beta-lactamase class C family)